MKSDIQRTQVSSRITTASAGLSFSRLSAERLAEFLADLQIGLLVENGQRRILYANPVLCRLMQITASPEELIGDSYASIVERTRPFLADVNAFLLHTEGRLSIQQQAQGELLSFSDGRILEFDYHPVSLNDEYQGHLWIFRDVTERERSQNPFLHQRRFVEAILEALPDILYTLKFPERKILYVSPKIATALGYTPDEVQTMGNTELSRLVHPDDLETVSNYYTRVHDVEDPHASIEYRIAHRDGSWRWFQMYETVFRRDYEGKPNQVLGIARDITERKAMEAERNTALTALREMEQRLAHAQAVAHIGSWEYDFASNKGAWSPETFRLFGFDPADPLPDPMVFTERFHPEDRERLDEGMQNALKRGASFSFDLRLLKRDGSAIRWVHITGGPTVESGRRETATRLTGVIQDIEERHQLEDQLRHSDRMQALGQFAAEITHEINNPIAAISGVAQLLQHHPDPQVSEDGHTIREMADRAGHIVRSLRRFVQEGSTFPSASPHPFMDINTTVKSALALIKRQRGLAASGLETHFAEGIPLVPADSAQIEQIIVNLVTNARQAMSGLPRGERLLTIHTGFQEEGPRQIYVRVSDTGPGIPEEISERIFAPFFTTKTRTKGMGLGLSICRSIARSHGGDISVESAPGTGAHFTLWLPVPPSLYDRSNLL